MPITVGTRASLLFGSASDVYIMQDADAIAYMANFTDAPNYAERAVDRLVLYLKANNLWTELHWMFLTLPTMETLKVLTDLKTNTLSGSAAIFGTGNRYPNIFPSGVVFNSAHNQYAFFDRLIESTANSTLVAWRNQINKPQGTEYVLGALTVSASQAALFQERNSSDLLTTRVFQSGTAQAQGSNASSKGRIIANRNASNYLEQVKDGSILVTATGAHTGTVPTHKPFWGALNTTGTPSLYGIGIYPYILNMNGLSTANRAILDTGLAQFETDMKLNYTKHVILDGNSLTALDGAGNINYRMFKRALLTLAENNVMWLAQGLGIGGQQTAAMTADFVTDVVPKFNSGATTKVYIPWEVTNDYNNNGNTTTALSNYWTLCDTAQAAGYTVVAMAMIARTYVGNVAGLSETVFNLGMDTIQQGLRSDWASHADYFIDTTDTNLWVDRSSYASDAAYNTAIAAIVANSTYYTDGVHLTNTGFDLKGVQVGNLLLTI